MDNIRFAAHRETGKVLALAFFGNGRILISRLHTSDEGKTTGLSFLELPEAEQINKAILLTEEEQKTLLHKSSIIFEFSSVKSIDALMNMLLECRNALTSEAIKEQPLPELLDEFMIYLNTFYTSADGSWRHRITRSGLVSITEVWKEFKSLT